MSDKRGCNGDLWTLVVHRGMIGSEQRDDEERMSICRDDPTVFDLSYIAVASSVCTVQWRRRRGRQED